MRERSFKISWRGTPSPDGMDRLGVAVRLIFESAQRSKKETPRSKLEAALRNHRARENRNGEGR